MTQKEKNQIIFVTGLSGAGLSSVLKALEDMGFEAFDNFPLSLIDPLLKKKRTKPIAFGIDSRSREFDTAKIIASAQDLKAKIIFISCDKNILQRRFKETRRRHPMATKTTISKGIEHEHKIFKKIQDSADISIDTSDLNIHDLRHILEGHFKSQNQGTIAISLKSFGFRYGAPREADIIWDVRFLQNPNWIKSLKEKTGKHKAVGKYIEQDPDFLNFYNQLQALLETTLPRYTHEGKNYLTIAIGCTGGRHRSVYIIEKLGKWLKSLDCIVSIDHRDISNI